jgi:hypothetical protein
VSGNFTGGQFLKLGNSPENYILGCAKTRAINNNLYLPKKLIIGAH